jgi:hypothetical protein
MLNYFTDEMVLATVYRRAAGSFVSGVWVPGAQTSATVAIIEPQPVSANELMPSEQGEDIRDFLRTYSAAALKTRADGVDADVIGWAGHRYLVHQVERRHRDAFFKIIMRRTNDR